MSAADLHDVVIIGGGPAGSTAAALLAGAGRRVLVLEKEKFPRYAVGESLLPFCYHPLARLGVLDRMDGPRLSVPKFSVQFVSLEGKLATPFYFDQHIDHPLARTWQVLRSEFDLMLLDNARRAGAEVMEETTVRELVRRDGVVTGVRAQPATGAAREFPARIVVDASGRSSFGASAHRWRVNDRGLDRVAVWDYFAGASRDPGRDEGATTVAYLPDKGWLWYIPLPDDVVSVGAVARKETLFVGNDKDPHSVLGRQLAVNPWIADHLAPARRLYRTRATGDYSYRSRYCAANGLVLIGDAFAFLDPVFSSGVFLALKSGEMAADSVDEALAAGDVRAERFTPYGRRLCAGIEAMRRLVYVFYDTGFSFATMFRKHPWSRRDLTDCLIGDLERDFSRLWEAAAEFAELPGTLPHGGPQVGPHDEVSGGG